MSPLTDTQQAALAGLADRLISDPKLLDRIAPDPDAPVPAPPPPAPTVTAYIVTSDRDGAQVCGPYPRKADATAEQKRLTQEALALAPGALNDPTLEPAKPNTYSVQAAQVTEGVLS